MKNTEVVRLKLWFLLQSKSKEDRSSLVETLCLLLQSKSEEDRSSLLETWVFLRQK